MTLLERDGLLAQLDARWLEARAGPGQLVFIEGEAGIGKTSVLRAFAASMRAGTPVYWGACEAMGLTDDDAHRLVFAAAALAHGFAMLEAVATADYAMPGPVALEAVADATRRLTAGYVK